LTDSGIRHTAREAGCPGGARGSAAIAGSVCLTALKRDTPLVVAWAAVRNVEVATYQVIVTDTTTGRTFDAILANNKRSVTVPAEFLSATGEYELEVPAKAKVKGGTGNQTITGSTFQVTA
jgi:hypothetical protein